MLLLIAVLFEMGNFEECIIACENAIDIGREHRADYKIIAKFTQSFILLELSEEWEIHI